MSTPDLNPISYLVLGLVARDGPITPYGLKQAVAVGPAKLWRFPHTQLYTESARLADAGLLDEEREEGGRRRRLYTLTTEGRKALRAWLGDEAPGDFLLRDTTLMKLYFGAYSTDDQVRRIAAATARNARSEHAALRAAEERLIARGDRPHQLEVLRFGLQLTEMMASFWERIAADPPA